MQHLSALQDSCVKKLVIHFQQAKTTPAIPQLLKRKESFWKFKICFISITKVQKSLLKIQDPLPLTPPAIQIITEFQKEAS